MSSSTGAGRDGSAKAVAAGRIDKWLWSVRLYKSRALAAAAVGGGRAHLNGARVKAAHALRPGDRLRLSLEGRDVELDVLAIPARRGPAREARCCYLETEASRVRGERWRAQQRLAALALPRPERRPDKQQRRALLELRRRQGRE
jgi:ribosome-associated heat shock protein Hsp15